MPYVIRGKVEEQFGACTVTVDTLDLLPAPAEHSSNRKTSPSVMIHRPSCVKCAGE